VEEDSMKIVFDKKGCDSELIELREKQLTKLGSFIEADKIEYVDDGKSEKLVITKKDNTIVLIANGNELGGWLSIIFTDKQFKIEEV